MLDSNLDRRWENESIEGVTNVAIIAPRDEPFTNDPEPKVRLRFESISESLERVLK